MTKPTLSTPQYDLYLGDCRDVLPYLPPVDLLLTDPPYGIGESSKKNASRGGPDMRGKFYAPREYGENDWDKVPIDEPTMKAARDLAQWQIIFGGNYYQLPPTSCWLVWDKENGASDFADCEMAWTNFPKATRLLRYLWNGFQKAAPEPRFHPTQKPLGVMAWALSQAPANVGAVLDPFGGVFTTGLACIATGKRFIGIERDERYFEIGAQRLEAATGKFSSREFESSGLFAEVS